MDDEFDPKKELSEELFEEDLDDTDVDSFSVGKKKPKKPVDDLELGEEDESLDDLADLEDMDEEEEPEW